MRSEQHTSRRSAPARIPPLAPRPRARHRRAWSPDRRGRSRARRLGPRAQALARGLDVGLQPATCW